MPERREQIFTISELSKEFDITPRAIRFYEDKGLITPGRKGLNRIFSKRDRARLTLILHLKKVGFSLSDISQILDLYDIPDGQLTQGRVALLKFKDRITALEQQQVEIDLAIEKLKEGCEVIENHLAEQTERRDRSDTDGVIGFSVAPQPQVS